MRQRVVAYDDRILIGWLLELIEEGSPEFLASLAEAAILASPGEYAILRPTLLQLKQQHFRAKVTMCVKVARRFEMGRRGAHAEAPKERQP